MNIKTKNTWPKKLHYLDFAHKLLLWGIIEVKKL